MVVDHKRKRVAERTVARQNAEPTTGRTTKLMVGRTGARMAEQVAGWTVVMAAERFGIPAEHPTRVRFGCVRGLWTRSLGGGVEMVALPPGGAAG